jgi:hypothetical protein
MAKHTPGPWHFEAGRIWQRGDNPEPIACADTYPEETEREANARLIAAAPDLLAALIDAVALLRVYTSPAGRDGPNPHTRGQALSTMKEAQEAIAKATD